MSSGVFLLKDNDKMEQTQSEKIRVVVKNMNSNGILLQNAKGISLKSGGVKAEYILQVAEQDANDDIQQAQFVAIENECVEGEEVESQFVPLEMVDEGQIIIQDKDVILWDELCRICANTSDKVVPIFSGEGLEHNLCKKIQNYLPLTISETDTLPLQVCYNCAATLLAWHEMTQNCLGAQERLIELQNKLNSKNQEQGNVSDGEGGEIIDNETKMEATSNQEDQVQAEADQKNIQVVEHAVDESEIDRCLFGKGLVIQLTSRNAPKANNTTRNKRGAKLSSKANEPRRTQQQSQASPHPAQVWVNGVRCYQCPHCNRLNSTPISHAAHLRTEHNQSSEQPPRRKWTCDLCNKLFTAASSLKRHVREVHLKLKQWDCGYCTRKLASRESRDEHERSHTDERPFECEACGKRFRQRASLSVHKRFHSRLVSFECEICARQFPRKQDCQRHVLTHARKQR